MEFSLRYPPVQGRLHTRYAPVRRSSPVYCYTALPLDLHVLSLPLAFILSQDQTLHCKNCFVLPFDSSRVAHISIYVCRHTLSLSSHPFQITLAFFNRRFFGESGCKDTTFFQYAKIFFQRNAFRRADIAVLQRRASAKNFRRVRFPAPQNGAARGKKGGKSIPGGRNRPSEGQNRDISLWLNWLFAYFGASRRELSTINPPGSVEGTETQLRACTVPAP